MDAPSPSVSARAEHENTRQSSRLKSKPRFDVVRLLSENLAMPKVTPEDRRRLLKMRAEEGLTADGKDARRSALSSRRWVRTTATIEVGTDGEKRVITVYPCRVCDFMGRTPQSAKKHEDKTHPHKQRCKVCSKYLHSYPELEVHARDVHQLMPTAIKCETCEFIAPDRPALDAHVEYEHYTGAKRNEYCRELVDGRQCSARFVQIRELRKHLAAVHGLDAALDTIQEEFASWEEFMRWKAQFELETGSVYKIGYGRRHGNRRYMCVRSGRYKPVPDEVRQRRPRENRTIKLGYNCTATITCKFPDTGGVRVVVHPFHYGHQPGDIRLPGMKPEGAPDDWIRPDARKKKKRKLNAKPEVDVVTVDWTGPTDGESAPVAVTSADEPPTTSGAEPSSQESAAAPAPEMETAETPPDDPPPADQSDSGDGPLAAAGSGDDPLAAAGSGDVPLAAAGSGDVPLAAAGSGDDPLAAACSGDGDGGGGKLAAADLADTQQPLDSASEFTAASCWQPYRPPRRKPGPKSKRGPPSSRPPSPPPVRRGPFGRPLPPPARPGPGSRYKKLLRRAKLMQRLRRQLSGQLQRLATARQQQARPAAAAVDECLIGTALEDVSELDDAPPPLAVLRAEPGDLDTLPDGVFPELELLTAPTDLHTATATIFDLKMEVLALRARLVRRAAVEAALRADALEGAARQATTERELRVELERARAGQGGAAQQLRQMLESVFSPAQMQALEEPAASVHWAAEDYEQAIALRWICSQEAFNFVRHGLKVPLPSMSAARAVAADGRLPHVAEAFLELMQVKTMEGETVGEDGDAELEMHVVMDGPEETVAALPAEPELPRTAAHDHGFSPALDQPPPPVVYRRRRHKQRPAAAEGAAAVPVRNIRLRTADGEQAVSVTVRLAETEHEVWQQPDETPAAPLDQFEAGPCADHEFIGPDGVDAGDGQELTIVTTPPDRNNGRRERF